MATNKKRSVLEQYIIDNISIPDYFNKYIYANLKPGLTAMTDHDGSSSLCPFHDDVNPSFRYWKPKKLFMCFGCRASGDVINLHRLTVQAKTHKPMSREAAIKDLCRLYNIIYKPNKTYHTGTGIDDSSNAIEVPEDAPDAKVVEDISVFDRCRKEMLISEALADHRKSFNLNIYKTQNAQIRGNSNLTLQQKFAAYAELDLLACTAISCTDDKLEAANNLTIGDIRDAI